MIEKIQFTVLIATTIFIILLLFFLLRLKNKSQMHYVFISIISLMIVWDFGTGLYRYFYINGHDIFAFIYVEYVGPCFIPVPILLMGIVFARTRVKFDYRYVLLFVVPATSYSLLLTNQYHHLFFIKYSYIANDIVFGKYFIIHALYSYACILVGLSYLVYFTIRDFGMFSKQLIIILIGLFFPLIINVLFTFKILFVNPMSAPISFSIAIICFFIAIFKYDFLLVLPIAMRTVVDKISNCFVVIDLEFRVVDFNKTFIDTFSCIIDIKRKDNFLRLLENMKFINATDLKGYIEQVQEVEKPIIFEKHFSKEGYMDKFFMVEITPIIHKKSRLGTIVMLTDITEHKENMRIIKEQQQQIIEKERLASLGTLMGGISHNLKTPIMSISGCIAVLEDLSNEYRESVGNPIVTENDHYEIANEIQSNLGDLKSHISYISNALTAIKNQVINPDARKEASFTLVELILNIEFLMKYEVKLNLCTLSIDIDKEIKKDDLINGDVGTLVQIINNLISNSIQSYASAKSTHETEISKRKVEIIVKKNGNYMIFEIKDYGKGISYEIKDKLFKEMVTTKGKAGSGIGLYLSYSKVRLMFNGDMWFESEEGFGTSFYVKVKAQ